MLTRKPSNLVDDAQGRNPAWNQPGWPSETSLVPPIGGGGDANYGGEPEACRLVLVNLSAYMDNELDPDQAQLVAEHLNSCADCAALKNTMEDADEAIQREWRASAPLPSSSEFSRSIDAIMDALPPVPSDTETFAPKRVHARTRWMRFATGTWGFVLAVGMLWSSYRLGYDHGRSSARRSAFAMPTHDSDFARLQTLLSYSLPATNSTQLPNAAPPLTFTRERRPQQ